jgi:universal stress protein E
MMRFTNVQHILCASDLTQRSVVALRRAAALAKRIGARLTLLHVVPWEQEERMTRMRANRAYAQLLSHADRAIDPATSFEVVIRIGNAREMIAKASRELDVDLVVVAPPKSRRLESIIGTTAERLVRNARRPVLIAQQDVLDDYRDVVVAADLSDATRPLLHRTISLAGLANAWTTIVHAFEPAHRDKLRTAGVAESAIETYVQRSLEDARRELMQIAVSAGLSPSATRVQVRSEAPSAAITGILQELRPELLAIGASRWFAMKRLVIGSVADQVLRSAQCDVLVIPNRPSAIKFNANEVVAAESLAGVGATDSVAAMPRFVSVERGLHQQDRSERRAAAYE